MQRLRFAPKAKATTTVAIAMIEFVKRTTTVSLSLRAASKYANLILEGSHFERRLVDVGLGELPIDIECSIESPPALAMHTVREKAA